ncbi:hypothetical protein [Parafrankia elaeagni]
MADPDRRRAAGIPDDLEFATKPALASRLVATATTPRCAPRWRSVA